MAINAVLVNLEDYLKEHDELIELRIKYQDVKMQVEVEKKNRKKITDYILEKKICSYRLKNYKLEGLIDPTKWEFAFYDDVQFLNGLGITYEEMIEFIKNKYQEYMLSKEKEEEEVSND